jgi:hypothetical protein
MHRHTNMPTNKKLVLGFVLILLTQQWTTAFGNSPFRHWWAEAMVSLAAARSEPSAVTTTLQLAPLVGGPKWFKVHVKVRLLKSSGETHAWDFVPRDATRPETLAKLLSFQTVPAEIRYQQQQHRRRRRHGSAVSDWVDDQEPPPYSDDNNNNRPTRANLVVTKANKFCETYSLNLHLIHNNCWTFAVRLLWHLNEKDNATPTYTASGPDETSELPS